MFTPVKSKPSSAKPVTPAKPSAGQRLRQALTPSPGRVHRPASTSPLKVISTGSPPRVQLGIQHRQLQMDLTEQGVNAKQLRKLKTLLDTAGGKILRDRNPTGVQEHPDDYPLQAYGQLKAGTEKAVCVRLYGELPRKNTSGQQLNDSTMLECFVVIDQNGEAEFHADSAAASKCANST